MAWNEADEDRLVFARKSPHSPEWRAAWDRLDGFLRLQLGKMLRWDRGIRPDDVLGCVCLKLLVNRAALEAPSDDSAHKGGFAAYVTRIARNCIYDGVRADRRPPDVCSLYETSVAVQGGESAFDRDRLRLVADRCVQKWLASRHGCPKLLAMVRKIRRRGTVPLAERLADDEGWQARSRRRKRSTLRHLVAAALHDLLQRILRENGESDQRRWRIDDHSDVLRLNELATALDILRDEDWARHCGDHLDIERAPREPVDEDVDVEIPLAKAPAAQVKARMVDRSRSGCLIRLADDPDDPARVLDLLTEIRLRDTAGAMRSGIVVRSDPVPAGQEYGVEWTGDGGA